MSKKKKKTEEVEIFLPDDILLKLALEAHNQDITLNKLCNKIVKEKIIEEEILEEVRKEIKKRRNKNIK